tara:strand:+ start:1337 stop:1450 length:114 start_codon:yes stop_codon:yes gene_type:complete
LDKKTISAAAMTFPYYNIEDKKLVGVYGIEGIYKVID